MASKILIVEDSPITRIVLRAKLARAFYTPLAAEDGASALAALNETRPDLLLLDLELPDMSGLDVLARLRADRTHAATPVIVITACTDRATRLAALSAGADEILTKPVDDELLLARIRSLLRRSADLPAPAGGDHATGFDLAEAAACYEHPGLVAVVTRCTEQRLRLARDLALRTGHRVTALSREDVLSATRPEGPRPEAFVLDADADTGLHFLSELRTRPDSSHAGVLLICAGNGRAAMAFDLGADEVVAPDIDPEELALRLAALMRRTRAAQQRRNSLNDSLRLAMTDPLTGLYNRRFALAELARIAAEARSDATPFSVLLIDLDRFKSVNDRFGHATGDLVLTEISRRLSANLRQGDLLARIGGEEFLLALPQADLSEARTIAQRLCDAVKGDAITLPAAAPPLTVTISIGLASGQSGEAIDALIDRADRALFKAKAKGRNQVATALRAA